MLIFRCTLTESNLHQFGTIVMSGLLDSTIHQG